MKKAILIALIILAGYLSFGQKIRFSDSSNSWTVFEYSCGGDPNRVDSFVFRYTSDTVIKGVQYRKLFSKYGAVSYIREDTLLKKVFTISPIHDTDSTEKLLYDYNLHPGDTLYGVYSSQRVDSIGAVTINGISHQVWYFSPTVPWGFGSSFIGYIVVEGIGCLNSPTYPLYPYFFEGCTTLTCFSSNGMNPILSHKVGYYFDNTSSCSLTFGLGVKDISKRESSVSPNPINNSSKLTLPHTSSGVLTIINSIGQVIARLTFSNADEIIFGDKVTIPGIYYYHVTDQQTGKTFSGSFVR